MVKKLAKPGIAIMMALFMIVISSTFGATTVAAASVYDDVAVQAQSMATILTSLYGETSVQYAVIDNGEIVISGQSGVYSKENNTPPTNENMYGIGSVSKVFTTAAVMRLVEQGLVELDAPVVNYIPWFWMPDERYRDITVRMLLNHSSGLMGSTTSNGFLYNDNDTFCMDTLLLQLATQRLKADPGQYSVYCNDGFSLAQLLIETVSGVSFSEYIKTNFTDPLNMENTKTPLDNFDREKLVKTYSQGSTTALPVENDNTIGTGGIYSTAEDMCRFAKIFMYDTDDTVLSDVSSEAMAQKEYLRGIWCPDEDESLINYGLGWDSVNNYPFTQYGIKALVKGGDTLVYHSSLIVLPEEGIAMAVLSSGGGSAYDQVFAQEILLKVLLAKGVITSIIPDKTFTAPVQVTMPSSEKANTGYYAYLDKTAKVGISDDGILNLYLGALPQPYVYTGDGKFYSADGNSRISFENESNGAVYLYVHTYLTLPYLGQIATASYIAQKMPDNAISTEIKAQWDNRIGKIYLLLNEKYSSMAYNRTPFFQIAYTEGLEGYIGSLKITGANTLNSFIQVPRMYGRDCNDITFYNICNKEYLKAGSRIYISYDAINNLPSNNAFNVWIGLGGLAKWYKIGSESAGRTIEVTLPENASFSIYDATGACTFCSLTSSARTVTLPASGGIVFAGDPLKMIRVRYVN